MGINRKPPGRSRWYSSAKLQKLATLLVTGRMGGASESVLKRRLTPRRLGVSIGFRCGPLQWSGALTAAVDRRFGRIRGLVYYGSRMLMPGFNHRGSF